jgi:hypothetical protein
MSTAHVVDEALELQVFAREELVHLMKVRDFSTTELGVRCERSAHSIKCYAEGRADPPAGVVGLMAHALGVPVETLFRPARPGEVEMMTVVAPRRLRRIYK